MNLLTKIIVAVSLVGSLFSINSVASPVSTLPKPGCLSTTNSNICVTESIVDDNGFTKVGEYKITNYSNQPVYAFAVTNPISDNAFTYQPTWNGRAMTAQEWDSGQIFDFFDNQSDMYFDPVTNGYVFEIPHVAFSFNTANLGTYADLFGTTEQTVNFYWNEHYGFTGNQLLQNGLLLDQFYWGKNILASNIGVFGADGKVLATSLPPSTVPLPAPLALLFTGLGLIGVVKRRQNQI